MMGSSYIGVIDLVKAREGSQISRQLWVTTPFPKEIMAI
jgi:hypothetical protein